VIGIYLPFKLQPAIGKRADNSLWFPHSFQLVRRRSFAVVNASVSSALQPACEPACLSLCNVRNMSQQRCIAAGLELSETISICRLRTLCRCIWFWKDDLFPGRKTNKV